LDPLKLLSRLTCEWWANFHCRNQKRSYKDVHTLRRARKTLVPISEATEYTKWRSLSWIASTLKLKATILKVVYLGNNSSGTHQCVFIYSTVNTRCYCWRWWKLQISTRDQETSKGNEHFTAQSDEFGLELEGSRRRGSSLELKIFNCNKQE